MPRLWPIAAAVAVAAAWAGAGWIAMSPHAGATTLSNTDQAGAGEVRAGLRSLKGEVLGKDRQLRGDKVIGGVVRPRDEVFDYTPREVCVKMKLDYPEQYANLDCSKPEYDSPKAWNEWE